MSDPPIAPNSNCRRSQLKSLAHLGIGSWIRPPSRGFYKSRACLTAYLCLKLRRSRALDLKHLLNSPEYSYG